jgi:DNA-binding transcriptional LysR family regulator
MDNWDEIKTAYHVARLGTVSGAADVLGVHHATVIRHIDALEGQLGVKLFQRHQRGYTATEAGEDLMRVGQATDDQFNQLASRIKGRGADVSGDLVVTSLASLSAQLAPLLTAFQQNYPGLNVRFLTGERLFRLEYGEAHVAIRAGAPPDQPDNVVQHLVDLPIGAYASRSYVAGHGIPEGPSSYGQHRFVGSDDPESRAPFYVWMRENVPDHAIKFRCSDSTAAEAATLAGAGIGFLPAAVAKTHPELVEIHPPREAWQSPLWLVTHMDLHRTLKVQTLLAFIKAKAQDGAF